MRDAVQPAQMQLETRVGKITEPVTADVIARTVAGLTAVGEAYVILDDAVRRSNVVSGRTCGNAQCRQLSRLLDDL